MFAPREDPLVGVKLPFRSDPGPQWAVSVGPSILRLVRAGVRVDPVRTLRVEVAREAPIPGPDRPGRFETLREELGDLLAAGSGPRPRRVLLSLPGVDTVVRKTSLPTDRPDRIAELVSYEAGRELPIPSNRAIVDHQVLSRGENTTELLLVGVRRATLSAYEEALGERGCSPHVVETAPVSLYNLYRFTRPNISSGNPTEAKLLLHLEENSAELVRVRGEEFLGARSVLFTKNATDPSDSTMEASPPEDPGPVKAPRPGESNPAPQPPDPRPGKQPDRKNPWDDEGFMEELRRAFQSLGGGEQPGDVGEILLSGRSSLVHGVEGVLERNFGIRTTPLNPVSRVEGLGLEEVPGTLVGLGLSLRNSDGVAALRINLRPSNARDRPGPSSGPPKRYWVAGLTVLLFVQLAASAYLRGRDRRQRLVRTRRIANRLRPILRRVGRTRDRIQRLEGHLLRVRRARSLNRGILELLDRLNRMPPTLRATTRFRRFWLKPGENRRLQLGGTTGSYARLGELYRWLLGFDRVVEIRRENQSPRPPVGDRGGSNRVHFEVTLTLDLDAKRDRRTKPGS